MTDRALVDSLDDAALIPFLPLIHVAWADGELSDSEIASIREVVMSRDALAVRETLAAWLDPARPPSPVAIAELGRRIRLLAPTDETPRTVEELGRDLADRHAGMTEVAAATLHRAATLVGPLGVDLADAITNSVRLRPIDRPTPRFDVAALTEIIDGRHAPVRARMRRLLSEPFFLRPLDLEVDRHRELVLEWAIRLADEGIGRLSYPAPHGDDDIGSFIAAFGIIAHHDISLLTKFGVQFGLWGGAVARLGTTSHHDAYLPRTASLELPGGFAMTETGHGSNVAELETTAHYDGATDELVVHTPHDLARKDYIGNAAVHGRIAVVFCRLIVADEDHGVHAVVVPLRSADGRPLEGMRIEDNGPKQGLNGVDNGRIWFDRVRVPRTALLDRFARIDDDGTYRSDIPSRARRFFTTIGTLVGGRVSVGSAAVNVSKSALTIAVRYAHRRRQFGVDRTSERLLIDYPAHRMRLIPRLAGTYAYHFAFEQLIDDYAAGDGDQREIEARAAALKAFGSWHANDVIQAAREACGGQGYLAENRLAQMRADADIFTTYEGDNTVLAQQVTKSALSDFGQEFSSLNWAGTVRYVVRRAVAAAVEAAPGIGGVGPDDIVARDGLASVLRAREMHQTEALARRVRARVDDGMAAFDAFADVQDHVLAVARSFTERSVFDAFASAVDRTEGAEADVLHRLLLVFGLDRVLADGGWFLEHAEMSPAASKAARRERRRLVSELAHDALALVDAFAIPDVLIAAPIALGDTVEADQ